MTKPWEMHENTIKKLYSEHKLADVRRIMTEQYSFTASTRAYRGRLKRWGTQKYNCKRRNERDSSLPGANDIYWDGADTTSPMMTPYAMSSTYNVATGYSGSRSIGDSCQMDTTSQVGQQRAPTNSSYRQSYGESSKDKPMLSPPQSEASYSWGIPITHMPSSSNSSSFGHAGPSDSSSYYECTSATPPLDTHSSTATYAPGHRHAGANRGLGYYQVQGKHNSGTGQTEIPYIPMRDYGYAHVPGPGSGLGPDDSIDDDVDMDDAKRSPSSDA